MKRLSLTFALSLAIAVLAGLVAFALSPEGRGAWLAGAATAAVVGVLTLVLKSALTRGSTSGSAVVKTVLAAQLLSFMLRLIGAGLGAFITQQQGGRPELFVIAFIAVSLAQQALETRNLLSQPTTP